MKRKKGKATLIVSYGKDGLPEYVADSVSEMAKKMKLDPTGIHHILKRKHKRDPKYHKIEIEIGEDDNEM